ncbi:fibronectin type III domain-containing protein [Granulosicoccus antarcticus]|uniref:Fibronectin type-III domain-containing protein n=1 Tax=Granulosicoccus antarcticus IMCC3135 TaxID=1192854 RepID=A0A2Z2P081_9GAMM|nr:fibronectin type III domain-containing protein [Granulosicoccus antarcticus]ASJ72814.1 hypothetical protein IMCC3135_13645 [Granulosicoccus antarcticus IMCC3135]
MNSTGRVRHSVVLTTGILLSASALADTTAPGNLRYAVYSNTAAELFWDRASTDDGYVSGYEITRNGEVLDMRDGLSLFITDLQPGTENVFAITSISSVGERSTSVSASIDTGSATPPFNSAALAAPTGLRSNRYSSQAFELFWDRVEGQAYQYDVEINGTAAGSTDGTSFFVGDETLYRDESGELQVTLVARNAAGASSAQSLLALTAGDGNGVPDDGEDEPPVAGDDALLSLEGAGSLLQELTSLMRNNGLTEHLGTLIYLNSIDGNNYSSVEVLENTSNTFYTSDALYRRECVDGGSVKHRVEWSYHLFYKHSYNVSDCRFPDYRLVSGFGTYTNEYDGYVYIGNRWTGYRGEFDALVVEQGDTRETMTASLIQNKTAQGQFRPGDPDNVRRYLRIEDGEYDYEQGDVEVQVRDWSHRFNRYDPNTGENAFNRLNSTFTVSASWTDGQTLDIDAVFDGRGEEAPWFDSGRLHIVSDNGDTLEVLAGTGDPETYQLVSTVNGVTVSEIRRWDVNGCELVNTTWQQDLEREQCVFMPPLG